MHSQARTADIENKQDLRLSTSLFGHTKHTNYSNYLQDSKRSIQDQIKRMFVLIK
jgi:hypothetical protein